MVRIALGITIALLLAACFFSFETQTHVVTLRGDLADTKQQLASTQHELATTKDELKKTQDDLTAANSQIDQLKQTLATTQDSLDKANAQVTDLTNKVTDLQGQINAMHSGTNNTPTPQVATFTQADMDAVNSKLKDAQAQVAELNQVKDTLTTKLKDSESHADDLQKQVDHYRIPLVRNGLEGEVLAVNEGWNFVVLSLGDRQGVVSNTTMILKRGDEEIGKVRVTSVEPSTSVADIVPGSLARGIRVQPGDKVIFLNSTGGAGGG